MNQVILSIHFLVILGENQKKYKENTLPENENRDRIVI